MMNKKLLSLFIILIFLNFSLSTSSRELYGDFYVVSWNPSGNALFTVDFGFGPNIWQADENDTERPLSPTSLYLNRFNILTINWNTDNQIVFSTDDGLIGIANSTNRFSNYFIFNDDLISGFNPVWLNQGKTIVVINSTGLLVFNPIERVIEKNIPDVSKYSASGNTLAVLYKNNTFSVLNTRNWQQLHSFSFNFTKKDLPIERIWWDEINKIMLIKNNVQRIEKIMIDDYQKTVLIENTKQITITDLSWNPDMNGQFVYGDAKGWVRIFDIISNKESILFQSRYASGIDKLDWGSKLQIAIASSDRLIIWETQSQSTVDIALIPDEPGIFPLPFLDFAIFIILPVSVIIILVSIFIYKRILQ